MSEQTRDLTINIKAKADSSSVTKVAQQVKTVVDQTQAAMKRAADIDPFARIAGSSVEARLKKAARGLEEISSGASIVKERLREAFGVSNADKSIARGLQMISDKLADIKRQASQINLGGSFNESAFLGKVRKVENEIRKVKSASNAMFSASAAGLGNAVGGASQIAAGVSILGSGNQTFENVAVKAIEVSAAMQILSGSKAALTGIIGSVFNLTNALGAMGKAAALSRQLAGSLGLVSAAAPGYTGYGMLGTSLRLAAGAGIGGAIGHAAGLGPIGTAGSAIAGAGIFHYAPRAIGALGIGGAGITATALGLPAAAALGATIAFPSVAHAAEPALPYVGWVGSAYDALSRPFGMSNRAYYNMLGRTNPANLHPAESAAALQRARENLARNNELFTRFGLTQTDLDNAANIAARFHIAGQQRELNRSYDVTLASQSAAAQAAYHGGVAERALMRGTDVYNESVANLSRPGGFTLDAFARAQRETDKVAALMRAGGPGTADMAARVASIGTQQAMAQSDYTSIHARAAEARAKLARSKYLHDQLYPSPEAQFASVFGFGNALHAPSQTRAQMSAEYQRIGAISQKDVDDLEKRETESAKRLLDLNQQLVSSKKGQREQALGLLKAEDETYRTASKRNAEAAKAIRGAQYNAKGSFGLMGEDEQLRALDIAKRLSRGESLGRDDISFARGIGPLSNMVSSLGREQADKGGIFAQIENLARPGDLSRNREAEIQEAEAKRTENLAVQIENKLELTARVNADSISKDLDAVVRPAIDQMLDNLRQQLRGMLTLNQFNQWQQQNHGAANAGQQQ